MYSSAKEYVTLTADVLFAFFIVHPLNVFFWRGTWDLYNVYIFPGTSHDQQLKNHVTCLIAGSVVYLLAMWSLPLMEKYMEPQGQWKVLGTVFRRVFLYIVNLSTVGFWKGLWDLFVLYLGKGGVNSGICYAIVQMIVWLVRGSNGTLSTPYGVRIDTKTNFYKGSPRFKTKVTHSQILNIIIV